MSFPNKKIIRCKNRLFLFLICFVNGLLTNCDTALSDKSCCIAMVIKDWKENEIVAGTKMEMKASEV